MGFTLIQMEHTIGSTLIFYKTVKFKGHEARGYDDREDLKFCTQIGPIKYFQSPNFLLIAMAPCGPHKGVRTKFALMEFAGEPSPLMMCI